jgi:hypothetical protein
MRARHLFVGPKGRASGIICGTLVALGCAVAAAPAGAHWRAGTPTHREHYRGGYYEHLSGYGPHGEGVTVLAAGLNQPKKLSIAPDGSVLVALSGDGAESASCTTAGEEHLCLDHSGAIDRISPWGQVSTALGGLPSMASEGSATGPAQARYVNGRLEVLFQDTGIDAASGAAPFGSEGSLFGTLSSFPAWGGGGPFVQADFGAFEAKNNPDGGEGTGVEKGLESAIDSDPYSFVPYHGGYAVADAAADDLLWVAPWGRIYVLAVFPTIPETAPPGMFGPEAVPVQAQPVPDSVAVGPDGALYVGELGGVPFNVNSSSVFRVVPGHAPTVVASGFTAIGDIAFDSTGRLLVLEIDQAGIADPALEEGKLPTPGAIVGVHRNGSKSLLASTGLEFPTGLAVSPRGTVYASNFGILSASGGPEGLSGEVVKVGLPWWWSSHPW